MLTWLVVLCIDLPAVEEESWGRSLCGESMAGHLPRLRPSGVPPPNFHGSEGKGYDCDMTEFVSRMGRKTPDVEAEGVEVGEEGIERQQGPGRSR